MSQSLAFAPVYPFRRPDLADLVRAFTRKSVGAAVLVRLTPTSRGATPAWISSYVTRYTRSASSRRSSTP